MTAWTNLKDEPRARYGDIFPSPAFPHAKDLAGIFLPYAAAFCIAFGALLAGFQFPDNSLPRSILSGAGLAGCVFIGLFLFLAYRQVEREWTLHEDERRARIVPVKAARIPFPPMRFVQFIWTQYEKNSKFPTVDECEQNSFNRQLIQEWYQQMVNAGALTNRIPKQYAGDPTWSRSRFEEMARADNALP